MSLQTLLPRLLLLCAVPLCGDTATWDALPAPILTPVEAPRVERFVLEWQGEDPLPVGRRKLVLEARRARVVGLASLRRSLKDGKLQLEFELDFPGEDLRLLCVEHLGERGTRLIWREMSSGRGRTLRAEWSADGVSLETAEWDGRGRRSRSAALDEGGVLPQYLLELARTGRVLSGSFRVFDPLAGSLETQEISTTYETGVEEHLERVVRMRRTDGTLAGEYHFQDDVLSSFRLQNGRLAARAVEEEAYLEARTLYHAGAPAGSESKLETEAGTESSSAATRR